MCFIPGTKQHFVMKSWIRAVPGRHFEDIGSGEHDIPLSN